MKSETKSILVNKNDYYDPGNIRWRTTIGL